MKLYLGPHQRKIPLLRPTQSRFYDGTGDDDGDGDGGDDDDDIP